MTETMMDKAILSALITVHGWSEEQFTELKRLALIVCELDTRKFTYEDVLSYMSSKYPKDAE